MKYNININQERLSKEPDITISDCAVIDYLSVMCSSLSEKIESNRLDGFTWINLTHMMNEMPLLRLKTKSGASKAISRIRKMGFVETKIVASDRKLYVKPTPKMVGIYFNSGVSQEKQGVSSGKQECFLQETNHNTKDNNTNNINNKTEMQSGEPEVSNKVTLSLERGKDPVKRLISLYGSLFSKEYGFTHKHNYGVLTKVFKELLGYYSEIQLATLLVIYFQWNGMTGNEQREREYLVKNTFPPLMFKSSINKYEAYVRNVLSIKEFDDDIHMKPLLAVMANNQLRN